MWIPDATEEYVLAHVTKNDSTGIDVSASHIVRVRCASPHAISPERTQAVVALTCAQVRVDGTGKTITLAPGTKLANRNLAHVEAAENLTQLQYARLSPVFAESRSVCGGACDWERPGTWTSPTFSTICGCDSTATRSTRKASVCAPFVRACCSWGLC